MCDTSICTYVSANLQHQVPEPSLWCDQWRPARRGRSIGWGTKSGTLFLRSWWWEYKGLSNECKVVGGREGEEMYRTREEGVEGGREQLGKTAGLTIGMTSLRRAKSSCFTHPLRAAFNLCPQAEWRFSFAEAEAVYIKTCVLFIIISWI